MFLFWLKDYGEVVVLQLQFTAGECVDYRRGLPELYLCVGGGVCLRYSNLLPRVAGMSNSGFQMFCHCFRGAFAGSVYIEVIYLLVSAGFWPSGNHCQTDPRK